MPDPTSPPSTLVVPREVTVSITFLVNGMDEQLAHTWCGAGVTVAIPQAAAIRDVAIGSKPASVQLVKPH